MALDATSYHQPYQRSEYREAWDRVREYYLYVRRHPKHTRTDLVEDILHAYREVLWNWAKEKTRPVRAFFWLCLRLIKILEPLLS